MQKWTGQEGSCISVAGKILDREFAAMYRPFGFLELSEHPSMDNGVQNGMMIDLIEIKSGNDYTKHPALDNMMKTDNWSFGEKIVLCKGNIRTQGETLYLPWYMIMLYRPDPVPE